MFLEKLKKDVEVRILDKGTILARNTYTVVPPN